MHTTPTPSALFPYTTLFRSRIEPDSRLGGRIKFREPTHHIAHVNGVADRSEEHTSELQSHHELVCRLLLEKKRPAPRIEFRYRPSAPAPWQPRSGSGWSGAA